MKHRMDIKTPLFKGPNRNPGRFVGTADGYVDAVEVVGVTSGVDMVENVQDSTANKDAQAKARTGNIFSILTFQGGARLLVVGVPQVVQAALEKALDETPPKPLETEDGNGAPAEKLA